MSDRAVDGCALAPGGAPGTREERREARRHPRRSHSWAISANKVRSGLTVLGIVIGIASVIALLAIGQGSTRAPSRRASSRSGANLLTVAPGFSRSAGPVQRGPRERHARLTVADAQAIATDDPPDSGHRPPGGRPLPEWWPRRDNTNTQVIGTVPAYQRCSNVTSCRRVRSSPTSAARTPREVAVLGSTARHRPLRRSGQRGHRPYRADHPHQEHAVHRDRRDREQRRHGLQQRRTTPSTSL